MRLIAIFFCCGLAVAQTTTPSVSASNNGLVATLTSGRTLTFSYTNVGAGPAARIDIWMDGIGVVGSSLSAPSYSTTSPTWNCCAIFSRTVTVPAVAAGYAHNLVLLISFGGPSSDPGLRVSLTYDYDGTSYSRPSAPTITSHTALKTGRFGIFNLGYINATGGVTGFPANMSLGTVSLNIWEGMFDALTYSDYTSALAQFNARLTRYLAFQATHPDVHLVVIGDDATRGSNMANTLSGTGAGTAACTIGTFNATCAYRGAWLTQFLIILQSYASIVDSIRWCDEADLFVTASSSNINTFLGLIPPSFTIPQSWTVHSPGNSTPVTSGSYSAVQWQAASSYQGPYYSFADNQYGGTYYDTGTSPATTASAYQTFYWIVSSLNGVSTTVPWDGFMTVAGTSGGQDGVSPDLVAFQAFVNFALGATGHSSYFLEPTISGQFGAAPTGSADIVARWNAMKASYNLIGKLQAGYNISGSTSYSFPDSIDVLCSTRGPLKIAINLVESPRASTCGTGTPSYWMQGGNSMSLSSWSGTLAPHQVAIWAPTQATPIVVGATPTQIILAYKSAGASSCSISGKNLTSGASIPDLNPSLFSGADTDTSRTLAAGFRWPSVINGLWRTVFIGEHNVQDDLALDGKRYTRGLQSGASYSFTVTCGISTSSVTASTSQAPIGNNYPDQAIVNVPGTFPQPTIDYANRTVTYVDSVTGTLLRRATSPSDILNSSNPTGQTFKFAYDSSSAWTNPNNALTNQSSATLASTSTPNAPLFLAWNDIAPYAQLSLNDIGVTLYGKGLAGTEIASVCISKDSGQTCSTGTVDVTFGTTASIQGLVPSGYPTSFFSGWGNLSGGFGIFDIRNVSFTGANAAGSTITLPNSGGYPTDSIGANTDRLPGSKFLMSSCFSGSTQALTIGPLSAPQNSLAITAAESGLAKTNCTYQDYGAGIRIVLKNSGTLSVSATYSVSWGGSSTGGSNGYKDISYATKVYDIATDCDGVAQSPPLTGQLVQYSDAAYTEIFLIQDNGRTCLQSILYNPLISGSLFGISNPWVGPKTFLSQTYYNNHVWRSSKTDTNYSEYVPGLGPASDRFTPVDVTAAATPLTTQLNSYPYGNGVPKIALATGLFGSPSPSGIVGGNVIETAAPSGQDSACLKLITDQNGALEQAIDSWSKYPVIGGGCHSGPFGTGNSYIVQVNPLAQQTVGRVLGGPFLLPLTAVLKNGSWATYTLPAVTVTVGSPTTLTFASATDLPTASNWALGAYITCSGGSGGYAALNSTFHATFVSSTQVTVPVGTSAPGSGTITCTTAPPILNTTVASVTGTTTARVTIGTPAGYLLYDPSGAHHLADGDSVVFAGLSQTTPYYVKASCSGCSNQQVDIYSDVGLTTPVSQATIAAASWISSASACPTSDLIPGPIYFDSGHAGGIVRCVGMQFSSQPCSEWANGAEAASFPCATNAAFSTLANLQPGASIYDATHLAADGNQTHESCLVLSVTVNSPTNIQVTCMRWYGNDSAWNHDGHTSNSYCCSHSPGWQPMWYTTVPSAWMDASDTSNTWKPENPIYSRYHHDLGPTPSGLSYAAPLNGLDDQFAVSFAAILAIPPTTTHNSIGTWAADSTDIASAFIQSYPVHRQSTASAAENVWKADMNAINASFGGSQGQATGTGITRTVTLQAGTSYTYKITVPAGTFNPKLVPYMMTMGRGLLADISSPATGNVLADSTAGYWCGALRANECRTGSSPGDVFFSWRGIFEPPSHECYANNQSTPVPCFYPMWPNAGQYVQIQQSPLDFFGNKTRRLTGGFSAPLSNFTFGNWTPTPDGKWGVFAANVLGGSPSGGLNGAVTLAMQIPPWPAQDAIDRTSWTQVPVRVTGTAGDTVRIKFGYAENGPPTAGYCTSRAEACWTTSAPTAASPYLYAFESQSLTSCGTGCTIKVPAIPGRILYYQIERTPSGASAIIGPLQWVAVQ